VQTTESNNSEQKRDWAALVFPVLLLLLTLCGTLYFWRLRAAPLEDFDEAY